MVEPSEKRWPAFNAEIPTRMGIVDDIEKFDATFFGVPYKQSNTMDPQCRLLIETAYEAILDAGVCPKSIRGSKTGVFIGACFGESDKVFFFDQVTESGHGITGFVRAFFVFFFRFASLSLWRRLLGSKRGENKMDFCK